MGTTAPQSLDDRDDRNTGVNTLPSMASAKSPPGLGQPIQVVRLLLHQFQPMLLVYRCMERKRNLVVLTCRVHPMKAMF